MPIGTPVTIAIATETPTSDDVLERPLPDHRQVRDDEVRSSPRSLPFEPFGRFLAGSIIAQCDRVPAPVRIATRTGSIRDPCLSGAKRPLWPGARPRMSRRPASPWIRLYQVREMRGRGEAGRDRDLDDRPVGIEQQFARPLDAQLHVVAQRRQPAMRAGTAARAGAGSARRAGRYPASESGFSIWRLHQPSTAWRTWRRQLARRFEPAAALVVALVADALMVELVGDAARPDRRRAGRRSDAASCPWRPCRPNRSAGRGRSRRSCWCSRGRENPPETRSGSPSGSCSDSPSSRPARASR